MRRVTLARIAVSRAASRWLLGRPELLCALADAYQHPGRHVLNAIFLPIAALTFGSGLCAALIWRGLITEAVGIAGTMLGWLIRDASAASAFYFGTSIGSSRKAAELAQERKP